MIQLNFKRNTISKQFAAVWKMAFNFHDNGTSAEEIIESVKVLEKNGLIHQEVILVFSLKNFEPLYITANAKDAIGFRVDELINLKTSMFFKLVSVQDLPFLFKTVKWLKSFQKIEEEKGVVSREVEMYQCGIKSLLIQGQSRIFFNRSTFVRGENNELPEILICYLSDVTHLFRGDFYWGFYRSGTLTNKLSRLFTSTGDTKAFNSLVTEREKEILIHFASGKSNKEIGAELNISTGTVEKHRKNMLKRTGARDTTALIHLCKICKIL